MKTLNKIGLGIVIVTVVFFNIASVRAETPSVTPTATVTPTPRATNKGNAIKEVALNRAKTLATTLFDKQFLAKLNALRAKVAANEKIEADAKLAILTKIDEEILWTTNKKETILSCTTLLQVRTVVREARTRFIQFGKEIRRLHIARGFIVSLERIVENIEKNILVKVELKLTELATKGVDVTAEQTLLAEAKSELLSVKTDIAAIKSSTTFDMAKKSFNDAKTHLKAVRQTLKELLEGLRLKI